ncbi:hypothetical protein M422DRAFT_256036 [Sphaerobolus stellatus SS14]|uniref:Uncharacterized protein n=1 Tax=Sphaerobolus stellatus (strain SS14) TaxID=990650 RepID=A0A0C9VS78_SPHS4|nr:hypothetical protein M422DRAFT_256036 [Sphaerobolus stellatus SS14]
MAHKKTNDKVPAGTSDAVDSGSTTNVTRGKDPNQAVSATSETNIPRPTTQKTCANNPLTKMTPNPPGGDGDPPPPEKCSELPEPSE